MFQPTTTSNEESIRTFWRAYMAWIKTATDEEVVRLEAALTNLQTAEVMPIVRAIRLVLRDDLATRELPASLMQQLEEASWPAAQATG
ncbi:MAG: hypothetical protein JF606_15200 [Burkholderiales bacterium]|nr:hypothetical protein [Burkholderiales bacterium]